MNVYSNLLSPYHLPSGLELKNRVVMAPMTRCRAINGLPNSMMAKYYSQRSTAGLIITEGTAPIPDGQGYARMPGIYSKSQTEGWALIVSEVHVNGGKVFLQLMDSGRVSHLDNMPEGAIVRSPSGISITRKKLFVDNKGLLPISPSKSMTTQDVDKAIDGYVTAAKNAVLAGFDGIELHGANGYLIEQFLNPKVNRRGDRYGGSFEKRCQFLLDVLSELGKEISHSKIGVRLSPFSTFNEMPSYPEAQSQYLYLISQLSQFGLAYLHLLDHQHWGVPGMPDHFVNKVRETFSGTLMLCGSYNPQKAERHLANGRCDLVAFGRPFISNPDWVYRIKINAISTIPDVKTFYSSDAQGYTDYPFSS